MELLFVYIRFLAARRMRQLASAIKTKFVDCITTDRMQTFTSKSHSQESRNQFRESQVLHMEAC